MSVDNALILQDVRREAIVRELTEKTKNGLVWTYGGGTNFTATRVTGADTWTYYVTKTQVGTLSYKYNLEIRKNGTSFVSLTSDAFAGSGRDSQVQDLYQVVETITLQLDAKAREALRVLQNIPGFTQL